MHIKPYLGEEIGRGKSGFADCGESGFCWFTICILSPEEKKNLESMLPISQYARRYWRSGIFLSTNQKQSSHISIWPRRTKLMTKESHFEEESPGDHISHLVPNCAVTRT